MRNSFSFDYTSNLADVKFGIRLSQWGSPRRTIRTLILGFVLPAAFMTALLSISANGIEVRWAAVLGCAFAIVWGTLFLTVFNAWMARTIFARLTRNGATQHVVVDSATVEHRNFVSANRVSWEAVTSVREFERAFLLMTGDRLIGSIEKTNAMSGADLDELRSFIKSIKTLEPGKGLRLAPL